MKKKTYLVFVLLLTLVFVGGVLMSTANAGSVYVEGPFTGEYFYDDGSSSMFEGIFYQEGVRIWGECIDIVDGSSSKITGKVNGNRMNFIKTYYSDNHRVQYTGSLIPETNNVKGYWRIDQNNRGTFTMTIRGNRM